jgi:hypothetical protein
MSTKEVNNGPDERPKAYRYRDRINAVEEMIVNALPEIAAKLISMAKDGDVAAARYLFDRMAGQPSRLPLPPSIDRAIPYTALDWSADLLERKDKRENKSSVYMSSILARRYNQSGDPKPNSFPGIGTPSVDITGQDRHRR